VDLPIQEHEGALSFGTDAWTSPNHKAFIAVTVHFEQNREPMCLLLDLVEVARSHSGGNLASVFAKILDDFGIEHKVSLLGHLNKEMRLTVTSRARFSALHAIMHHRTT
jgi:hypothetical protein